MSNRVTEAPALHGRLQRAGRGEGDVGPGSEQPMLPARVHSEAAMLPGRAYKEETE